MVRELPGLICAARTAWSLPADTPLAHYVFHPGGARVLAAYQESLVLDEAQLAQRATYCATMVICPAQRCCSCWRAFWKPCRAAGAYGVMLALGPGFSAEQLLFLW